MKDIFKEYLRYYEKLSAESVDALRLLASEQIHFVDPFNDLRGVDRMINIFEDMFKRVDSPKFEILDALDSGERLFVRWRMSFSSRLIKYGRRHEIVGVTVATIGYDGKVAEHTDYWDSASQLYAHLPLVGFIVRGLQRLFA